MATKPPNGIYTFSGRPGSSYKYENNQWFVSNSGTKNQYVPMQDPTGNRAKTLEAGLKSGKTQFTQGLGAAQKYPNGGGMKTVKSKDGTITNKFTNKEGNTVVQVKTKDGRYYEKVLEPQIKPLDNTPRYQNALLNNPAVVADNTRVANADFAADAMANRGNVARAVAAEKKAQYEFEKNKWDYYNKQDLANQIGDRAKAFMVDPLGMASRFVSGEQAYIPGMGDALVNHEDPNRDRYLKAVGYTPGKFEASDIQNMINPAYWGASIGSNLKRGNYGTAAVEGALTFAPFLPKGSAGLARQGAGMIADDIARGYNNVATGNTFLADLGVRAWKNPAANLDGAVSETMFNKILQSDNFTPAEKAMLKEYQFANYPFVKPGPKQDAFHKLIGKANLTFPEDAVVTRAFTNPETELQAFTGAADDIKTISMQERPSAFSAGVSNKDKYYYDKNNRIVLSGKNLKKVEGNFIKQRYQPLEEGYYTNIPDEELTVGDFSKRPGEYNIGDHYYGTSRLTPDEVAAQAEAVYAKNNALYSDTSKTWLKPSDDPNFLTGKPKSNNPADGVFTAEESAEIFKKQQDEYQENLRLFTDPANKKEAIENIISDARKGFANQKGPSDELELFGSGFDMKVVGKFPNKHGGFDYVVKPKNIKKLNVSSDLPKLFKSGLGNVGMDMSMYTIKNPDYYTQLLNTYDKKALSATNRKFYKDLIATVKKQDGLVTERQLNELKRLATGNFNYGPKDYSAPLKAGFDENFITRPLTPFGKTELTPGNQWYRKIGNEKGLQDLINKQSATAPAPMRMKSGITLDAPFFGRGQSPAESYKGLYAVELKPEAASKYQWASRVAGVDNYGSVPLQNDKILKGVPLEDLNVYKKKWFSNNYKELDPNNLEEGLKHAALQRNLENIYKWGARGYLGKSAYDYMNKPDSNKKYGGYNKGYAEGGSLNEWPPKKSPIYVTNPRDSRLKAYNDSLSLYNKTKDIQNPKYYTNGEPSWYNWKGTTKDAEKFMRKNNVDLDYEYYRTGKFPGKIQPIKTGYFGEGMAYPIYKKPIQPYIYKKPELEVISTFLPPTNVEDGFEPPAIVGENITSDYKMPDDFFPPSPIANEIPITTPIPKFVDSKRYDSNLKKWVVEPMILENSKEAQYNKEREDWKEKNKFKQGGNLAKNIPTYYNYSGTPIYRDTTALPFPDGGYLSLQNAMLGPLPEREKPNSVLAYNKFVEATKTPNQSAYIRPSYSPESNHYKYGFFGANSGNIYGGAGYGVPKYGLEANVFGSLPAQSDPYYKGFYSAELAKQFGNNQVGLGVSSPVVGYTDDSGFHMDRLELTPQLSFRKNFAEGGPLETDPKPKPKPESVTVTDSRDKRIDKYHKDNTTVYIPFKRKKSTEELPSQFTIPLDALQDSFEPPAIVGEENKSEFKIPDNFFEPSPIANEVPTIVPKFVDTRKYDSNLNKWIQNPMAIQDSTEAQYDKQRWEWAKKNIENPANISYKFADGGPLNDKTNHGKILNSIYASALGDYYASGGMLKRADGSYSRRGLWDNIRAAAARNKAQGKPGKAPTKEMLEQAKVSSKANGGFVAGRQMYQPLDIRESYGGFLYGNGGQFPTTFSLPEDSFKQGGNNLHDSVYASSMAQYPAVYGMGGSILSMSNTPELSGEGKDLSVPENAYIYSAGGSIKKFKKR